MLKNYANLSSGQTHYRRAGEGLPVVVLHPSPMSSSFMAPLMQAMIEGASVAAIAPDTPGYGGSDPLSAERLAESTTLTPYILWLEEFVAHLELEQFVLYGSATGAQIAIEYAKAYPHRVRHLVLENVAHIEHDEAQQMEQRYFPSLAPQADGSHLTEVWRIATALFQWFPWYQQDEAHRIASEEPPASIMHAVAMAYLNAGEDYAQAYRRAFRNERVESLQGLQIPTTLLKWSGSVVRGYWEGFESAALPANLSMQSVEGGPDERVCALVEAIKAAAK